MNVMSNTVAELEAAITFRALLAEYAAESAIDGLPPPDARMPSYRNLESLGLLHLLGAWHEGELVGFITMVVPVLPHYGVAVAVSESFFVAKAHRSTMAGLRLLCEAENKAHELGSPGLLVSAPYAGKLFELLPRLGYVETNRVFFKRVGTANIDRVRSRMMVPSMSDKGIEKVRRLESDRAAQPQVPIRTEHLLHGGMYARTVYVPAGLLITGALIKIATVLILEGDAMIYVEGDEPLHATGYNVLPASAGRKQAFVARTDMALTMIFPTAAETVEEAEAQFTDEDALLASRRDPALNDIVVTGE